MRRVRMFRGPALRSRLQVAVAAVAVASLAGCTASPTTDDRYDAWYQQMQTVFRDSDGIGGGGGAEPGTVQIGMMQPGKWTVHAVCNNTNLLHIRVRGASKTLAETDIPCGATITIPITVTEAGAHDLEIATSYPEGVTGPAWWSAEVNSTTWRQTQFFSFN